MCPRRRVHRRRAARAVSATRCWRRCWSGSCSSARASRLPRGRRAGAARPRGQARAGQEGARQLRLAHPHDLLATGDWDGVAARLLRRRAGAAVQAGLPRAVRRRRRRSEGRRDQLAPLRRPAGAAAAGDGAAGRPRLGRHRRRRASTGPSTTSGSPRGSTFHEAYYTPAEVEGLTLETVSLHPPRRARAAAAGEVPPRLFSEVMRDLDLVVSVAHRGGVDPEASASTVEMRAVAAPRDLPPAASSTTSASRASLHVLIDGELGSYSRPPRQRRRPTACRAAPCSSCRSTPSTAAACSCRSPTTTRRRRRCVSKVLLLARDHEIQDPTILEQIRG